MGGVCQDDLSNVIHQFEWHINDIAAEPNLDVEVYFANVGRTTHSRAVGFFALELVMLWAY